MIFSPSFNRPRIPWSDHEVRELRRLVAKYGSKWVKILLEGDFRLERTQGDLKDKWRNLKRK